MTCNVWITILERLAMGLGKLLTGKEFDLFISMQLATHQTIVVVLCYLNKMAKTDKWWNHRNGGGLLVAEISHKKIHLIMGTLFMNYSTGACIQ